MQRLSTAAGNEEQARNEVRAIDEIIVGDHRRDLGDIKGLAASITDVGLLQPIALTFDGYLIAGEPRIPQGRDSARDQRDARHPGVLAPPAAGDAAMTAEPRRTSFPQRRPSPNSVRLVPLPAAGTGPAGRCPS